MTAEGQTMMGAHTPGPVGNCEWCGETHPQRRLGYVGNDDMLVCEECAREQLCSLRLPMTVDAKGRAS